MPYDWKRGFFETSNSAVLTIVRFDLDNIQQMLCMSRIIDNNFLYTAATSVTLIYLISNPDVFIAIFEWVQRRLYRLRLFYMQNIENRFLRFLRSIQNESIPYTLSRNLRIYGGFTVVVSIGICHVFNMYRSLYIGEDSAGLHSRVCYATSIIFETIFLSVSRYWQNGRIVYRRNVFSLVSIPGSILLFFPNFWNRIYIAPIATSYIALIMQYWYMLKPFIPIDARPRNGEVSPLPRRILRPFANIPVIVRILDDGRDPEEQIEEPNGN